MSSYCNKFSAYWIAGTASCMRGEKSDKWCANFDAWSRQKAGLQFTYGYGPGDIDWAISVYEWGVANCEWHPVTSGYVASPAEVATYGLSRSIAPASPSAVREAIVTDDARSQSRPNVVDGTGDPTALSSRPGPIK